ncbi:MAG: hypothetical protein QOE90_2066 [Thermoplasmata archaeon]|jgi:hypothetical protein|nr:hypothetical protein [Thermoplasmata archaeon]
MDPTTRRTVFLGLGGLALLTLLAAGLSVFLALKATGTILLVAVVVLILVVAAEVVLWLVDRPRSG